MTSAPRLVVVAPDSFKGSLSAVEAAAAMERGVRAAWPDARIVKIPIADGGEGTVEALVSATGGRYETRTVRGPLGCPVEARWGVLGETWPYFRPNFPALDEARVEAGADEVCARVAARVLLLLLCRLFLALSLCVRARTRAPTTHS